MKTITVQNTEQLKSGKVVKLYIVVSLRPVTLSWHQPTMTYGRSQHCLVITRGQATGFCGSLHPVHIHRSPYCLNSSDGHQSCFQNFNLTTDALQPSKYGEHASDSLTTTTDLYTDQHATMCLFRQRFFRFSWDSDRWMVLLCSLSALKWLHWNKALYRPSISFGCQLCLLPTCQVLWYNHPHYIKLHI